MAARKRKILHDQDTRERIKSGQLITRLENHTFTHPNDPKYAQHIMADSQVRAALGLLKKTLPDLNATTLGVNEGDPLLELLKAIDGTTRGVRP
jgi:hypothetical protein